MSDKTKTQFTESDLRIHEDGGEVHVHDDGNGVKFKMPADEFKNKYAQLRADTLKSNSGLLFDDDGTELHAQLKGGNVKFMLRNAIVGFEKFDKFVETLA